MRKEASLGSVDKGKYRRRREVIKITIKVSEKAESYYLFTK